MEKNIVWIDANVYNDENKETLIQLKSKLNNFKFFIFTSVESAFSLIKSDSNFHFNLFYVIVSGRLAEIFFNEYNKTSLNYPIIAATIVYCYKQTYHEQKPYYLDPFLNPGKIVSSYDKIIDYIQLDECNWKNNMGIIQKAYIPKNDNFGNTFEYADSFSKIAYPVYLQKILNSSLIKKCDIKNLQHFLMTYFSQYKNLIKPSQEKNIDIPYHILAKFYLNLYSGENPQFYKFMNRDLTNKNFDTYKTFIFLMYNALNKKTIKNYNGLLYRGAVLNIEEFRQLENVYKKAKSDKNSSNKINIPLYISQTFLSFSKLEKKANEFLKPGSNNLIPVKYILHSNSSEEFISTNLDIESLSQIKSEREALILPLSCFEIINIQDKTVETIYQKIQVKEIHLKYLSEYKKQIDEHISQVKNKEKIQQFFEEVLNSKFSHEISVILGQEVHINLKNFFEQITPFQIDLNYKYVQKIIPEKLKPNMNPNAKAPEPGFSNGAQLNKLFSSEPISIQQVKLKSKGYNALILNYDDGTSCLIKNFGTKDGKYVIIKEYNETGQLGFSKSTYEKIGNEYNVKGVTTQEILVDIESKNNILNSEACASGSCKSAQKLSIERNGYCDYSICGAAIGHFVANIDKFIEGSINDKIKSLGMAALPIAMIPITKRVPILGPSLVVGGFAYNSFNDIISESLHKSEIFSSIAKNLAGTALDLGISFSFMQLGASISFSLGIVSGPGIVIFGLVGGFIGGLIGGLIGRFFENKLTLNSDCLYYKYIPKKFRNKINPNLRWENVSNNTKSFVIEMVDHYYNCRWLVLNIPSNIREIELNNKIGDTVIEYMGIPDNCFRVFFNLYELKNDKKINHEDWKDTKKMFSLITHVASLEVN